MNPLQIVFLVVQLITCSLLVLVIVLQSGKNSGLGALTGSHSDSFLSKNKQRSRDARLALATKWIAGAFVVLTVVLNLL
jgi:preprotein translocase subunit SecG